MSDSDKPFTVSDRRHFTPDGRVREDADKEAPARPSPDGEPPPEDGREGPRPPGASEEPPATPDEQPSKPQEASGPSGGDAEPVDFSQFLLSLGAQAGLLLSGQGLPEGADPKEALSGAHSIISILEMLQEKTKGNRTGREDEVLEGLLFELRMAYVEKSRTAES
jgi:hypothetical protein